MQLLSTETRMGKAVQTLILIGRESWQGFVLVLRVTLPIMLAIRILEEFFPLVDLVGALLAPLMEVLGLPGTAGIAWAAAILIQPVAGFAILAERWHELALTGAQATIFGVLVLEVHTILVEVRIAQLLGVRAWVTYVMRFGFAIGLCMLIDAFCRHFALLQEPVDLLFVVGDGTDRSWSSWFLFQAQAWSYFAVILYLMTLLMHLIRALNVEKFLIWLLRPFMALMGIHRNASTISLLGLVMGLSFGAALIMAEARRGSITPRDLFLSVTLLGICHSVIEDTLLAMVFGAHIAGVLFARVGFALLALALLSRLIDLLPRRFVARYLMVPLAVEPRQPQRG